MRRNCVTPSSNVYRVMRPSVRGQQHEVAHSRQRKELQQRLAECQTERDEWRDKTCTIQEAIGAYAFAIDQATKFQKELLESKAREAKLRDWIVDSGMVAPEDPINYALSFGRDNDTALREANKAYLNASPEVELLNQIGRFLEGIEYTGSYLDGIIAYGKQERRKALLEAAEIFFKEVKRGLGGYSAGSKLLRMAEKI